VVTLGAFDFSDFGPRARALEDELEELGYAVDGFAVKRVTSIAER
jgi:hypothetical protein